jgi:hypothetical protein
LNRTKDLFLGENLNSSKQNKNKRTRLERLYIILALIVAIKKETLMSSIITPI